LAPNAASWGRFFAYARSSALGWRIVTNDGS
jgi:hypothetical protein